MLPDIPAVVGEVALLKDRVCAELELLSLIEVELEEPLELEVGASGPAVAVNSLD